MSMLEKILNGLEAVLFFATAILFIGWVFSDLSGWFWVGTLLALVFISEVNT